MVTNAVVPGNEFVISWIIITNGKKKLDSSMPSTGPMTNRIVTSIPKPRQPFRRTEMIIERGMATDACSISSATNY